MVERRRISIAVVGVLALAATIHADMMPVSGLDSGYRQPLAVCDQAALQHTGLSNLFGCPGVADLDSLPLRSLPISNGDAGQTGWTQPVQVLSDGQTRFSLCLYALMGLGLCRPAPWVKRLSFGCIRDWYHDGGPHQIGHSHGVGPDLCLAPVICFIQPVCTAEDHAPQYHLATVVFLWRKSQFTSSVLAARGPPALFALRRF
jgi:hypothetical protein